MQLGLKEHVLVYHYAKGSKDRQQGLLDFLMRKQITFTSVDTTNDKILLRKDQIVIPDEYHVDMQMMFR